MSQHLQKHTLHLRKGDWDYIESICSPAGIATSQVIRALVSRFVNERRATEDNPDTSSFKVDL